MPEQRNYGNAVPVLILWGIFLSAYYYFAKPPALDFALTFLGSGGFIALIIMMVTFVPDEEHKSRLWGLKPLVDVWPAVEKPEGHVHFRTKMAWDIAILVMYFIMTNVAIYGIKPTTIDMFSDFRAIMAGASGSLMHLGIGPIVTGSIIMQLFTGAKIVNLDLTRAEDKAIYQGVQKIVVIVMIFVEAIPQTYGYLDPSSALISMTGGLTVARLVIIAQLAIGSYLVFLMDEVVSKWGIGSGVSMFIAAGVSQAIFTGTFNMYPSNASIDLAERLMPADVAADCPSGTLPKTWYIITHINTRDLALRGFESVFLSPPNPIIALLGTLTIFFIVAYAESMRIELPLAHGTARGARGRYPIRLIYTSNIPVILMSALLANVNMFALLFWSHPTMKQWPILGRNSWLGAYNPGESSPSMGLAWYLSRPNGVYEWLLPVLNPQRYPYTQGHEPWQVGLHAIVYLSVMVIGSILFAKFWIETTDMGPEAVARQIEHSGMQIPGFRRDPRILRKVLERYIPMVTVISGAFVGALAASADMIGTVGNTSGTGVLLTVGIMIQMYEAIGREQMIEMHPVLRGFFGEG